MDPADSLLGIEEVHGCGLFGAGGQQAVDTGAAQGGGLDVLGVGDQQDGQAVYWHWNVTWTHLTVSRVLKTEHPHYPPGRGVVRVLLLKCNCVQTCSSSSVTALRGGSVQTKHAFAVTVHTG